MRTLTTALSSLMLLTPIAAQVVVYSPAGADRCSGGSGSTLPFWGQSATYQQVHAYRDLTRLTSARSMTIKGLSLRPSGYAVWHPRSLEVQLMLASTTVTPAAAAGNKLFTDNYKAADATTVLPFTKFSLPRIEGKGGVNAPGLTLPFKSSFLWQNSPGNNLLWEWRHRNHTNSSPMFADQIFYIASTSYGTSFGCNSPAEGKACTATGQARPAHASSVLVGNNPVSRWFTLADVEPNQPALLFVGATRQPVSLPGLCSKLELAPVFSIPGLTSSVGSWSFAVTYPSLSNFQGRASNEVFLQYAFADSKLPSGIGLSEMMVVNTPIGGAVDLCQLWAMGYQNTTNTWSTATTATGAYENSGLVVGLHL